MESLATRHAIVMQVLKTLHTSIQLFNAGVKESEQWWANSDSVIQRFEYSIDTFWKYLKLYLKFKGLAPETTGSPKDVLRVAQEVGCITADEYEVLRDAVQDRNETSHSYNHDLAIEIVQRVPEYYEVIKEVITRLKPE